MKSTLKGINSKSEDAEQINNLVDRVMESTQAEQQIEKQKDTVQDLWNDIMCTNIHMIGVPEGEEGEKRVENLLEEITAKNFCNLGRERHTGPRITGSPKEDEPKEVHTRRHNN